MNKRNVFVLILVAATLILSLVLLGKGNTLYDNPTDMADGALACIHGWKDMDMFMPLTPYKEGTEIYDIAYSYFQGMMKDSGHVSEYRDTQCVDLKKINKFRYNEMKNMMEEYGVSGVKTIKAFSFKYHDYEEITIFVAEIGGKWYTVMAE